MRHGMANRKLGRTSSHRKAMLRNLIASMLESERIITTLPKAKEVRPLVEKMVTLGKEDSVHNRRLAARDLNDDGIVKKLFTDVSPRFSSRPGGYTRIIKLGPRRGDGAEMAILEFVDFKLESAAPAEKPKKEKKAAPPKAEENAGGEEQEAAPKKKPAAKKAAPKKEGGEKKSSAKKPAAKKPAAKKPAAKKKAE